MQNYFNDILLLLYLECILRPISGMAVVRRQELHLYSKLYFDTSIHLRKH